jgi:hypothetical protein
MKSAFGLALAIGATALLGGCNMVLTEKPMFTVADGAGAPAIRPGVWRDQKPGCDFDEGLPQDKWPKCASASPGPGEQPFWVEVSGDPLILQFPLHLPYGKAADDSYLYAAFRPLKLDAQGRVIAMKRWPVRCGPPPPPPEMPEAAKFDDSVTADRADRRLSEADKAKIAKARADLAKLQADSRKLLADLARTQPTKEPLPGLTMDSQAGSCAPISVEALRNAARASEAWADEDAISHWVRDRGPGDLPAATPSSLLEAAPGAGPGLAPLPAGLDDPPAAPKPDTAAVVRPPVAPAQGEAGCDADRIRYAAEIGVPCASLGTRLDLPVAAR